MNNSPAFLERGFKTRIYRHRCPGGYALFVFRDGIPPNELSYPTTHGGMFYQPGDIILTVQLPLTLYRRYFPELDRSFPVDDPLTLLANAFGATQTIGWLIRNIRPGHIAGRNAKKEGFGHIEMALVTIFGKQLVPTDRIRLWDTNSIATDIDRAYHNRLRIVRLAAEVVADIAVASLTAGGGSAAKTVLRKQVTAQLSKTLKWRFLRQSGVLLCIRFLKNGIVENGIQAIPTFIKAFAEAYSKTYMDQHVEAVAKGAELTEPVKEQFHNKAIKVGVAAGITAHVNALLGAAEGELLEEVEKGLPERLSATKTPTSLKAWVVSYVTKRVISNFSTGLVSKSVTTIGDAAKAWVEEDSDEEFSAYLNERIGENIELSEILNEELSAVVEGMASTAVESIKDID